MTARVLHSSEWQRIDEAAIPWRTLDPSRVTIIAVEQDGAIVGCWALAWALHANGVWIDPKHRSRGVVAGSLVDEMKRFASSWVNNVLISSVEDASIQSLVEKLGGVAVPGVEYKVAV